MNVADALSRGARAAPEAPAIVFERATLSYGQVERQASAVAAGLAGLGIGRGDRVALMLPNGPAFVLAYLALQKLGAVAVSINVMSVAREVEFALRDCGARAVVVDSTLRDRVPGQSVGNVIVTGAAAPGDIVFEALAANDGALDSAIDLPPDAPSGILYTSGTTGTPKGATLSHGNVVSNAAAAAHCYGARAGDRFLLFLPLFHCFGQNAIMNAAFASGACIVLQPRFVPDSVLELVRSGQVTHFFGVPSVYVRLLEHGVTSADLHHLRFVFSAAAPLSIEIFRRWRALTGHAIRQGYGLTESSPFATYSDASDDRAGSVGRPIDGVRVRVVDDAGQEVERGERGEIQIRGPNVMLGYWNRPDDTAAAICDGWLRTGDLGRMDRDDHLYVVDRIKEMIIVSGFKVYPSEVENVLHEHPAVAEPAVFGVPHPVFGEAVHARIVLKEGANVGQDELRSFCNERISTYKVPACFSFATSLPKSPAGKVLRRVLREETAQSEAKRLPDS